MKGSNSIELFKFSIEKVWKMILKMCGNPDLLIVREKKKSVFRARGKNMFRAVA